MFAQLSASIAAITEATAPLLAAVRAAPNRHVPAIRWRSDLLVTCDQALPALDSFTLVLAGGGIAEARTVRRDAALGLAALRLTGGGPVAAPVPVLPVEAGRLVLVLGVAFDASPTVRLAAIHQVGTAHRGNGAATIVLDLPADRFDAGSAVIDAGGGILGMASLDPAGTAIVIPHAVLAAFLEPQLDAGRPEAAIPAAAAAAPSPAAGQRGWLGVALQPTTLPDLLRPLAGQRSGRMVINITPNGPADHAGLRIGDVLLALDGQSVTGSHTLRGVINAERIGRQLEVRILRDGAIHTVPLVVAAQPAA